MFQEKFIADFKIMTQDMLKPFFENMEKKYKIPVGTFWKEWTGEKKDIDVPKTPQILSTPSSPPPTKEPKELKKSNYQVFFSIQRNKIMRENPSMTFGEISKKVSSMWKQVPPEEKKTYVQDENDQNHLDHLSIKELKKLCKDKQIESKNMKREDMIQALSKKPLKEPCSSGSKVLVTTPHLNSSRTKLELADEDKDEDDFFFEEELDSDQGLEEDELEEEEVDTGSDLEEDEDIFGEED